MKKHIPNFITLLNLCSGAISVLFALGGDLKLAGAMIILAAVFDFFDGFAARLLNVKSSIGKELDSLADMVSFGLAPGFIMYMLLAEANPWPLLDWNGILIFPLVSLLIPAFSALRLAKFNIDDRQETVFFGLPTPANALLIVSLPFIVSQHQWLFGELSGEIEILFSTAWFLTALCIVFSLLLVSELQLMSLKFSLFQYQANKNRYLLIGVSVLFLVLFQYLAIPLIMVLYIALSMVSIKHQSRM